MSQSTADIFDDILVKIANGIDGKEVVNALGKALGFIPAEISRYHRANQEDGGTYMGTLAMLRKWRQGQTWDVEWNNLKKALEGAGLKHLANTYLSSKQNEPETAAAATSPPSGSSKGPENNGNETRSSMPESHDYGMQPDIDGSYTKKISPARPDPAWLDARLSYNTWQHSWKGFAYILNNDDFPNMPLKLQKRPGSEIDVKNITHVFYQLGYTPLCYRNKTKREILDSLEDTVRQVNECGDKQSSLCLFFMSHGNEEGVCGTDDSEDEEKIVTRGNIKDLISGGNCKALIGKPKLIFIQACRGGTFTRRVDEPGAASFHTDKSTSQVDNKIFSLACHWDTANLAVDGGSLPENSDIYVANSTSDGYYSIRTPGGTWFVQAISEIFLQFAHQDELNELMRKVTCLVTQSFATTVRDEVTNRQFIPAQTPSYESQGMRKRFYFMPKYPSTDGKA